MIKTSYSDQPCERCNSKKKIINVRKVKTSTFNQATVIEYSQIICTNKVCQTEFENRLLEKQEKDAAIKLKRAEHKARLQLQHQVLKEAGS